MQGGRIRHRVPGVIIFPRKHLRGECLKAKVAWRARTKLLWLKPKHNGPTLLFLPETLPRGIKVFVPSKSAKLVGSSWKWCKACRVYPCQTNTMAAQLQNPVLEEEKHPMLHREGPVGHGWWSHPKNGVWAALPAQGAHGNRGWVSLPFQAMDPCHY